MNMMALRLGDDIIVIDAGMMFPESELLGVDLVIPDITYLKQNRAHVEAIVLTHGHEDHVGALPYLLRDLDRRVPIYGTAFTLELLKGKLEEHEVTDLVEPHVAVPGGGAEAGPFRMRFFHVTHSIPDGMAVAVDTPHGSVLHTGDFKLDQTPIDGQPTDLHGIAEE